MLFVLDDELELILLLDMLLALSVIKEGTEQRYNDKRENRLVDWLAGSMLGN
jgi:hypothetical protein